MDQQAKQPEDFDQPRRVIRVAEGYLELMSTFECGLSMDQELAQPLAGRMLKLLGKIEAPVDQQAYVSHLRGEACRFAGRFEEAIVHFSQANEIEPDRIHGLLAIAWCYKRVDQIEDAIEAMQVAIEFEPEQAICHYNLACYFAIAGLVSNAIEYLAHAFEIRPSLRDQVAGESDFDAIRDDPDFIEFLAPVG